MKKGIETVYSSWGRHAKDDPNPSDVVVGLSPVEKVEAALAKLFDPKSREAGGVVAFKGLREAYIAMTGDSDFHGRYCPQRIAMDLRSVQDFNSNSFAYALGNVMNMYLSKSYKDIPYREEILISDRKGTKDFRTIRSIQLGQFEDFPDVDPETEDYQRCAPYIDTAMDYQIGRKGVVILVTRDHIINDSIGLIKAMLERIGRAARRTHARYVWNFYINNAACPDETAWFTLDHGNLGADALDIAPLVAAITALANMTEPDPSNEPIGLDLATFDWHLVVPTSLWDLAVKKNQTDSIYTANDLTTKEPNPCLKLFGDHNERIVTCPFLTAANDWGIIRGTEDVPLVEMSYLDGKEEPEIIVVDDPTASDLMFRADAIGYKVRHEYGGALADYRGGYKAIFP